MLRPCSASASEASSTSSPCMAATRSWRGPCKGAGASALKKLMNSETRLGEMRAAEIARLLELGLKAERHALGESADRREMALATWNAVTTEMVKLFSEVNVESDPEARARLFAHGVDRIVDRHLAEVSDEREGSNAR